VKQNRFLVLVLAVSLIGSLTVLIVAWNPPLVKEDFPWRKLAAGSIFSLILLLGGAATFVPQMCSVGFLNKAAEKPRFAPEKLRSHAISTEFKGHHATCGKFSAHVIGSGEHILCAACTGLFVGSVISGMGTVAYFFGGFKFIDGSFFLVLIAQSMVFAGFAQFKLKGVVRSFANAFFVVGAFLTLMEIDRVAASFEVDLYVSVLIIFWLFARIELSQWDHSRICRSCGFSCIKKSLTD
jgi:hypothetical protein